MIPGGGINILHSFEWHKVLNKRCGNFLLFCLTQTTPGGAKFLLQHFGKRENVKGGEVGWSGTNYPGRDLCRALSCFLVCGLEKRWLERAENSYSNMHTCRGCWGLELLVITGKPANRRQTERQSVSHLKKNLITRTNVLWWNVWPGEGLGKYPRS